MDAILVIIQVGIMAIMASIQAMANLAGVEVSPAHVPMRIRVTQP